MSLKFDEAVARMQGIIEKLRSKFRRSWWNITRIGADTEAEKLRTFAGEEIDRLDAAIMDVAGNKMSQAEWNSRAANVEKMLDNALLMNDATPSALENIGKPLKEVGEKLAGVGGNIASAASILPFVLVAAVFLVIMSYKRTA